MPEAVRLALVGNGNASGSDPEGASEPLSATGLPLVERKPVLLTLTSPIFEKQAALVCLKAQARQVADRLVQTNVLGMVRALVNLKLAEWAVERGEQADLTRSLVQSAEEVAGVLASMKCAES